MTEVVTFINENPADTFDCKRKDFEADVMFTSINKDAKPLLVYVFNGHMTAWYDPKLKQGCIL